jgi:tetratricopeptide (TPR) repeat protein
MNIEKELKKAQKLSEQKKDREAIEKYSEILKYDPKNAEALCCRGILLARNNNIDDALVDMDAYVDINPNNPTVLCARGVMYFTRGDYGLAANDCTAALKINPDLESAKQYLGFALEKIGNDLAETLSNAGVDEYCDRALECAKTGDYNEVIKILSDGLEHYPESGKLLKPRAFYYFKLGNFDSSIEDCNKFIENNKDDDLVFAMRGLMKFNKGRPFEAEQDFREALRINPNCEHVPAFMKNIINRDKKC